MFWINRPYIGWFCNYSRRGLRSRPISEIDSLSIFILVLNTVVKFCRNLLPPFLDFLEHFHSVLVGSVSNENFTLFFLFFFLLFFFVFEDVCSSLTSVSSTMVSSLSASPSSKFNFVFQDTEQREYKQTRWNALKGFVVGTISMSSSSTFGTSSFFCVFLSVLVDILIYEIFPTNIPIKSWEYVGENRKQTKKLLYLCGYFHFFEIRGLWICTNWSCLVGDLLYFFVFQNQFFCEVPQFLCICHGTGS